MLSAVIRSERSYPAFPSGERTGIP